MIIVAMFIGIVLILESEADERFWVRLNAVIEEYNLPIKTYILRGEVLFEHSTFNIQHGTFNFQVKRIFLNRRPQR